MFFRSILCVIALHMSSIAAPPAVEQQAQYLKKILRQADDAYYNQNDSLMSDAAYDALRGQYDQLLNTWPELAAPDSVGTSPAAGTYVAHNAPVLSLKKAYSTAAVEEFLETCGSGQLYCVEPKIDGLTVVLRYRNGLLVRALTRGDGTKGTDITTAVLASDAIPARLKKSTLTLEIRGEACMPFSAFEALNRRRSENGQPPLKSPRNTAAGTLRLHDYAELSRRGLQIRCFELLASERNPTTHAASLEIIQAAGLPVIESRTVSAADVPAAIETINRKRARLPVPTDGVVVRLNDRAAIERLGHTAHHPRGALARKWKEVPKETCLLRVEWSRGQTGKLTPVAIFKPVEIDGATLRRASLYNENHLRAMGLKIGDRILVIRSGGSVPEVIGRSSANRDGSETEIPGPPNQLLSN